MDKKLNEIDEFSKEVIRELANNYSISTTGGLIAFDAVVEKDWISKTINITEEEYDKLLLAAKAVMTEEEIDLYSNPDVSPGCFIKQFKDTEEEFPTGFFYDEEEDLKEFIKEEFGDN